MCCDWYFHFFLFGEAEVLKTIYYFLFHCEGECVFGGMRRPTRGSKISSRKERRKGLLLEKRGRDSYEGEIFILS